MSFRSRIALLLPLMVLTACALPGPPPAPTPADLKQMTTYLDGSFRFSCRTFDCSQRWHAARRDGAALGLYRNEQWLDLVYKVVASNYEWDLGYFYLASAAEGSGRSEAAMTYYRLALSSTQKCSKYSPAYCDGLDIPALSEKGLDRIKSIEGEARKRKEASVQKERGEARNRELALEERNKREGEAAKVAELPEEARRKEKGEAAKAVELVEDARPKAAAKKREAAETSRLNAERDAAKARELAARTRVKEEREAAERREKAAIAKSRSMIRVANSQERASLAKVLERDLFDAESARYRDLQVIPRSWACVEVNAKNRFGGYTGFQFFAMQFVDGAWVTMQKIEYVSCLDVIARLHAKDQKN